MKTAAKNHPWVVTVCICALIAAHLGAARLELVPSLSSLLANQADAWGLYAGAAGATAVIGGFSGVLVVFAMTNNSVFARMRLRGGASLEANWMSTVASSLSATLLCVAAAAASLGGHGEFGAWTFELAVAIALHAGLRMLWLLGCLMTAIRRQDQVDARAAQSLSFEQIVGSTPAP